MVYDCPEMKPSLKHENRELEKELAHKSKDRFTELLNKHPSGLVKIECLKFDKYGRMLLHLLTFQTPIFTASSRHSRDFEKL